MASTPRRSETRGGHSPTDVLGGDLDSESPAPPASQHNMAAAIVETGQRHKRHLHEGSMEPKPRKHRWGSFLTTIERGFALNGCRRVRGGGEKIYPTWVNFLQRIGRWALTSLVGTAFKLGSSRIIIQDFTE